MKEWFIDGYNLLLSQEIGHNESARDYLFSRLINRFGDRGVRVTVVFDSRWALVSQRERVAPNITAVYAAGSADDYIIRAVRNSRYPRAITVVSNDREIISRTREYQSRSLSCGEFMALVAASSPALDPPEKPLSDHPDEIKRLLDLWGETE